MTAPNPNPPPVPHRSVAEILAGRDVDLADLAQQLDGHVRAAIDFSALDGLEQLLWGLLDRRRIDDDDGDLAKALLVEAVIRVVRDPASFYGAPPRGITKAERRAVEFDAACPFCQMERAAAADPMDNPVLDAEWLALTAEAAAAWRRQHAETLRRHGLGPSSVAG